MDPTSTTAQIAKVNDYLVRAPKEEVGATCLARFADRFLSVGIRKTIQMIWARALAGIVFPVACILDIGRYLGQSLVDKAVVVISKDPEVRKTYDQKMVEALDKTEKCFLGLITSPAGFVSPDIVTRHFLSKQFEQGTIEAGGKLYKVKGVEVFPESVEDVEHFIQEARLTGKKVTIAGAHYSQNKDTLPVDGQESLSLNMQKLNGVTIDVENKRARCQAGATWKDVQTAANAYGFAVKVMQASNVFSVGGSIGVNCHGWDHRSGTIAETIHSMLVVDGSGKYVRVFPEDPLFKAVVGGHGLFGAVVEAEIDLSDNEALVSWGKEIPIAEYADYFYANILSDENHQMHLFRLSLDPKNLLSSGVMQTYSRKTETFKRPSQGVSTLVDEPITGRRQDRILVHIARSNPSARALYWNMESKNILKEQKMLKNEIMRPPIHAAFNHSRADAEWLQEYFVKPQQLAPFLEAIGKILTKNNVKLLNASVRFVKEDTKSLMPYAKGSDHFALVLFFNQSLALEEVEKTKKWVQEAVDTVIAHEGTFYLPYQQFPTNAQFDACYDKKSINEAKQTLDPNGLFSNGLYEQYIKE